MIKNTRRLATTQSARVCVTRREALKSGIALALTGFGLKLAGAKSAHEKTLVGAIRWDAWYAPNSSETQSVERSLAPSQFHDRIPFFGDVRSSGAIFIDGGRQDIVDREIALATFAGINFWAFDAYEEKSPMSTALHLYLASTRENKPKFCMLAGVLGFASAERLAERTNWHIKLMRDPNYVRVQNARPIYILLGAPMPDLQRRWGGIENLNARLKDFRDRVRGEVGANAYILFCPPGGSLPDWTNSLDVDALTSYAIGGQLGHKSYRSLEKLSSAHWDELAQSGLNVAPTVMSGWDRRPRIEHPVPWETWQRPGKGEENYFDAPTGAELTSALKTALQWVERNSTPPRPRIVLIYAWNENDEGGWLIPTLYGGTSRLDAVRRAIQEPR